MRAELKNQITRGLLCLSVALVVVLAVLVFGLPAAAQSTAQSLLPSSFAGWNQSNSSSLSPQPGIAAAAAADYGFSSGTQATYTNGSNQITVALYKMKDASGAYGEYTLLRTPDMLQGDLAEYCAISGDHALVFVGNLVVDIHGQELPGKSAELRSLVGVVSPHAEQNALPPLLSELPEKGLIPRTEHYILGPAVLNQFFPVPMGDSLGFGNGAEAELAKYRVNGRDVTLLIVDYPTPQSAAGHLKGLQKEFDIVTDVKATNAKTAGAKALDLKQKNRAAAKQKSSAPTLYENRTLTSLFFLAGARSEKDAAVVLGHLESGEVLTLNSPTFSLTQPNIGTVVVGTIVGTGIICLFALISGLAFGGFRMAVKMVLPGKVFDRSSELDILQLGLASKPIKSEDFYGSPRMN
ncbi:MAG: DUF6599 family protein [Candidatus Acidiferrales bacterium]